MGIMYLILYDESVFNSRGTLKGTGWWIFPMEYPGDLILAKCRSLFDGVRRFLRPHFVGYLGIGSCRIIETVTS